MRLSVSEARNDVLVTNMAPALTTSVSGQVDFIFIVLFAFGCWLLVFNSGDTLDDGPTRRLWGVTLPLLASVLREITADVCRNSSPCSQTRSPICPSPARKKFQIQPAPWLNLRTRHVSQLINGMTGARNGLRPKSRGSPGGIEANPPSSRKSSSTPVKSISHKFAKFAGLRWTLAHRSLA